MPGLYTDGVVDVGPASLQGIPQTNGFGTYPQITGYEQAPFDTNLLNGANPASVAASAFNVAALYFQFTLTANQIAATSGAATLSKNTGLVTTEALTTAVGASYTLTLTNTLITPASQIQAAVFRSGATAGGPMAITNITANAGSCVITMVNNGSAALNGTLAVLFTVSPIN